MASTLSSSELRLMLLTGERIGFGRSEKMLDGPVTPRTEKTLRLCPQALSGLDSGKVREPEPERNVD
ncbi:uncharacterized protein N7443_007298 [Penicillium atrosanguineum]|uniref:uncharacterized protein n=1 Tax=Penicillium atrosanguineum TaxID=1132637 RepID=UPI002382F96D|nr:uncharacterized protein N7443_007298 [Penicillium atrosanguineum]KAJ5296405.1 hypothetical protein N7443_007298 [Penicillium atrosanguineum]